LHIVSRGSAGAILYCTWDACKYWRNIVKSMSINTGGINIVQRGSVKLGKDFTTRGVNIREKLYKAGV
jgi:hypothetical protein